MKNLLLHRHRAQENVSKAVRAGKRTEVPMVNPCAVRMYKSQHRFNNTILLRFLVWFVCFLRLTFLFCNARFIGLLVVLYLGFVGCITWLAR